MWLFWWSPVPVMPIKYSQRYFYPTVWFHIEHYSKSIFIFIRFLYNLYRISLVKITYCRKAASAYRWFFASKVSKKQYLYNIEHHVKSNEQDIYNDRYFFTPWSQFIRFKITFIYEELVSKTSYIHPDMLLICIIDFLLQLK